MICPKCNTENLDTNLFCTECGTELGTLTLGDTDDHDEATVVLDNNSYTNTPMYFGQTQVIGEEESYEQTQYFEQPQSFEQSYDYSKPSAVDIVKKFASSKKFMISTLCLTLTIFANLIYAVYLAISTVPTIIEWLPYLEDPAMIEQFSNAFSSTIGTSLGMIGSLPLTLVMVIAMWTIYKAGKNVAPGMKTGGLTTIKVISIINMIGSIFASLAGIGGALLMLLGGGFLGTLGIDDSTAATGGIALIIGSIILAVVMIAVLVISIIYYVAIIKSINAAIKTCRTGVPSFKVSRFVGVMCYFAAIGALCAPAFALVTPITAISAGFGILQSILNSLPYILYTFIVAVLSIVSSINFGIIIFKYRKAMKEYVAQYGE